MPSKEKYIDRKTKYPGVRELVNPTTNEVVSIYIWYYGPFDPTKNKRPKLQTSAIPDPRSPTGERPFKTINEARKYRNELEVQIRKGEYISTDWTLADALDYWYENQAMKKHKKGTLKLDKSRIDCIKRYPISRMTINELKHYHIQAFLDELATEKAPSTVKNYRSIITSALEFAHSTEKIPRNPAKAVDTIPVPRKPVVVPNSDDVFKLLDGLKQESQDNPLNYPSRMLYVYEHIANFKGIRIGEGVALQIGDFDPDNQTLYIGKTVLNFAGQPLQDETKNGRDRFLYLTHSEVKMINDYIEYLRNTLAALGITLTDDHFLFCNYRKRWDMILPDSAIGVSILRKWHYEALERHGLPRRNPHTSRHGISTIMQYEMNIKTKNVQEMLGHSDISTTANIYTHVPRQVLISDAQKLEDFFADKGYKP